MAAFVRHHGDPDAYLAENPDVAAAGEDAVRHWCGRGAAEGRRFPGVLVDDEDPAGSGPGASDDGTVRLLIAGASRVLRADPGYALERAFRTFVTDHGDATAYRDVNADVREAGLEPLGHWLDSGMAQGRQLPGVDVRWRDPGPREGWQALRWRGDPVLVRPHEPLPGIVVAAIRIQARHEPALLAPGQAAVPHLRRVDATRIIDRDGLDLPALLNRIPARPARVILTDDLAGNVGIRRAEHDATLVLVTGPGESTGRPDRDRPTEQGPIVLVEHLRPGVTLDSTLLARLLHALAPRELFVDGSDVGHETVERYGRALARTMHVVTGPEVGR